MEEQPGLPHRSHPAPGEALRLTTIYAVLGGLFWRFSKQKEKSEVDYAVYVQGPADWRTCSVLRGLPHLKTKGIRNMGTTERGAGSLVMAGVLQVTVFSALVLKMS